MGYPVVHWEIAGSDGKALQDFYAQLFDWKIDTNNPMNYGMVDTGGQGGINGGIFQYLSSYTQDLDLRSDGVGHRHAGRDGNPHRPR